MDDWTIGVYGVWRVSLEAPKCWFYEFQEYKEVDRKLTIRVSGFKTRSEAEKAAREKANHD